MVGPDDAILITELRHRLDFVAVVKGMVQRGAEAGQSRSLVILLPDYQEFSVRPQFKLRGTSPQVVELPSKLVRKPVLGCEWNHPLDAGIDGHKGQPHTETDGNTNQGENYSDHDSVG